MIKEKVYNLEGKETEEIELNSKIFGIKINPVVVQQVIEAYLANIREVLSDTKQIGDVRGGGKKPWKQKGTGRARQGSIRSPQWKGGAVTFGPLKERNFTKKINQKVKTKALFMALSDKINNQRLKVVENFDFSERKTKTLLSIIDKLGLKSKKVLIGMPKANRNLTDASRNMKNIKALPVNSFNVYALLKYEYLILTKESVDKITKHFLK